jgi:acetylornithine deacetylase/succinyl-diaminopimelate desuccinylase-like protein
MQWGSGASSTYPSRVAPESPILGTLAGRRRSPEGHAQVRPDVSRQNVHNSCHVSRGLRAFLLAAVVLGAAAGRVAADEWSRIGDEAAVLLGELIRVDTTNPPGGETAAAKVLAKKLAADGITSALHESAPGRGNLSARLPGAGGGRPVVLLSHLDVVPADPADWRVPPFAAKSEGGYLYGRGALDAKGVTAMQAMALIALKRSGQRLPRDVILLATADEETGGRAGAGWLVEHHPELLGNAEYLLTEGDHIHLRADGQRVVQVAVAEKTPCWVELTARGPSGHGSTPPHETAVTKLVRALEKLRLYEPPVRLVGPVKDYFAALAALEPEPLRERLTHLESSLDDPTFLAEFAKNPRQNALLHHTITPTVLSAGTKTNVIPGEARAQVDCRLLPGETPDAFLALLRGVIADEAVSIEPLLSFPASSSDRDSALMGALHTLATTRLDGAPVVPSVIPGFTDSHFFRGKGIASYGFVPFVLDEAEAKTVHGANERISLENLRQGPELLVALLRALP